MTDEEFQNKIKEKFNNEIECLDKFISYRKSISMRFKCNRDKLHNEIFTCSAQEMLRTKGKGCPFCNGQRKTDKMIKSELKKKFGDNIILKEKWNFTKNSS